VTNEDLLGVLVFEDGVGGSEFTFVGVWLTKMESGAGFVGVTSIVTIFPKETCQCPSRTTCHHHILATKMSIGPVEKKRVVNLRVLSTKS
jgi:hypothetical protein